MSEPAQGVLGGLSARAPSLRLLDRFAPQRVPPWEFAVAAVALSAIAVWATLQADFLAHPGWLAAQKADIILGPVLVGLYWLKRRPGSRFGPLLIATGFIAGVPYIFQSSSDPVLFGAGVLWEGVIYLATLILIVSFPTGRITGAAESAIVAVGAVAVLATLLVITLIAPEFGGTGSISGCDPACPPNGLSVVSKPTLAGDLLRIAQAAVVLIALATLVLVVWRLLTCTPPRRRALAVGAPIAVIFLLSQIVYQAMNLLELQTSELYPAAQWTIVGTRSAIWYGFLLALFAAELFAARVLRRVVIESLRRPELGELEAMLRRPLGDPGLRLAFRDGGDTWVDTRGDVLVPPGKGDGLRLTEVQRDGRAAAAIVHDIQLAEEPELLTAAGAIVLLVQENADLDERWQATLGDLRDSRSRIVAASEAERRKLERDLHDGAQQRLVSLRIRLAIASEQAGADPAAHAKLGEFEGELDEAIQELRDLAHGIFPSLLADRGVLPALRAVARRAPRSVRVTGHRIGRYPPEIESAVYYCCLEALQNATKHAGPSATIEAKLSANAEQLRLEVTDDGPGFDVLAPHDGVGLRNMEDRLGAVGGALTITSSPGNGMLITGVVPVASLPGHRHP